MLGLKSSVKKEMLKKRKDTRIVFMGTPEFARSSLENLIEEEYNVVGVFTNPDRASGRGMKVNISPVKECAINNDIPVYQPEKIRNNEEVINILKELEPDFLVVVAYGKILPKEVLDIAKLGSINVHGSLLPKYRGSAPIQWAIINGEVRTGITTMFMDEGMDTGDMLLKKDIEILETDTYGSLHDKLKVIGADLLVETLDKLLNKEVIREKQSNKFSLAPMITKEMTKIDFNKNPREIFNFVRGLSDFSGTYMLTEDGKKYKVYEVDWFIDKDIDNNIENGSILLLSKDKLYIKCDKGYVKILTIQPEGKKKMDIISFLAGNKMSISQKFI